MTGHSFNSGTSLWVLQIANLQPIWSVLRFPIGCVVIIETAIIGEESLCWWLQFHLVLNTQAIWAWRSSSSSSNSSSNSSIATTITSSMPAMPSSTKWWTSKLIKCSRFELVLIIINLSGTMSFLKHSSLGWVPFKFHGYHLLQLFTSLSCHYICLNRNMFEGVCMSLKLRDWGKLEHIGSFHATLNRKSPQGFRIVCHLCPNSINIASKLVFPS